MIAENKNDWTGDWIMNVISNTQKAGQNLLPCISKVASFFSSLFTCKGCA